MELGALKATLRDVEKANSSLDWNSKLNERKRAELEFHNKDRDKALTASLPQDTFEMLHGNKKYYLTTDLSRQYVDEWLKRETLGKVFLDYACGNGVAAISAASSGAALAIGIDISDVSVRNARLDAEARGVKDRCAFIQGDCENTGLPDNSVDTILCSGMLHHLDLSYAFPELRRVLRPGGKILCVEALDYNPLIKAYRLLTPSMRTDWEKNHILSLKDLVFAKRFFDLGEVRYWHLFSIFAAYLNRWPSLLRGAAAAGNLIDRVLMRIPLVRLMAWQFTFELVKRKDS